MKEQRRHQRIRFNVRPAIRIGQSGVAGAGELENLSLGGLMLRTPLSLRVGEAFGCEFSVFDATLIDITAIVVNKVGDCYGARFQTGPISAWLIQEAIDTALATGKASVLSVNEVLGRRVMRIVGGLNGCLNNDFIHSLTKIGIADMDLSGVTRIDDDGLELCRIAVEQHRVRLLNPSPCVAAGMAGYLIQSGSGLDVSLRA